MIDCPIEEENWWISPRVHHKAYAFIYKILTNKIENLKITRASEIVTISLDRATDDRFKAKKKPKEPSNQEPRGPFNKKPMHKNAKYYCIWNNNHETQKTMIIEPDCTLEKKPNATMDDVNHFLKYISHSHINLQVGYASQKLIAAYTEDKILGGRTWPNIVIEDKYQKTFTVWMNCVFGIATYWAMAGSQQPGRGIISRGGFKKFPILDFRKLSDKQLMDFDKLFDEISKQEMKTITQLDNDLVRQQLDKGVVKILDLKDINLQEIYDDLKEVLMELE